MSARRRCAVDRGAAPDQSRRRGTMTRRGGRKTKKQKPTRRNWISAQTFQDVCELTAWWVERGGYMPGYCANEEVDDETKPIVADLARLNRAGFLTTCSQPGVEQGDYARRAFVEGIALEPTARTLSRLTLCTDLLVLAAPPECEVHSQIPVTREEQDDVVYPFSWCGALGPWDQQGFIEACCPTAAADVQRTWAVQVIDPQWGRERYLWENVLPALRPEGIPSLLWRRLSERPHPDLALDHDFAY